MQRYFAVSKKNNEILLRNTDLYHIQKVMRMRSKDQIEAVLDEKLYLCELDMTNDLKIKVLNELPVETKKHYTTTLVVPILKEAKLDLVLQKATELGVDEIIVTPTERTIVKISAKEKNKLDRWETILKEASEQSKRVTIPKIRYINSFKELTNIDGLKIVCSTLICENIKTFLQTNSNCDKIVIVVGPEGGLSKDEENYLVSIGFNQISLGNLIMRVETVPINILSIINYEFME